MMNIGDIPFKMAANSHRLIISPSRVALGVHGRVEVFQKYLFSLGVFVKTPQKSSARLRHLTGSPARLRHLTGSSQTAASYWEYLVEYFINTPCKKPHLRKTSSASTGCGHMYWSLTQGISVHWLFVNTPPNTPSQMT